MIVDCFPFFKELDLLEIRLNELDPIIDYFVLVEASKTQSKLDKPFYFEENKERYSKFLHKIIHVKLEAYPEENGWAMENFQRNSVMLGLQQLDITDKDRIMISDIDEIPRTEAIISSLNDPKFQDLLLYTLDIDFYVYFMNLKAVNKIWPGAVIFKPEALTKFSVQNIKDGKNNYNKVPDAGWHFSWLGGYQKIREKALSCIEPYDKSKIPSEEDFKNYFTQYLLNPTKKFIHIEDLNMQGIDLDFNFDYKGYPKYLLDNFDKFKQYFYENDK